MIGTVFPRRPLALSLGDERAMDEMTGGSRRMPNWKVVGRGSVLAEFLKVEQRGIIVLFHNTLVNAAVESSSNWYLLQAPR